MIEVSYRVFCKATKENNFIDVTSSVRGNYPYWSEWFFRNGELAAIEKPNNYSLSEKLYNELKKHEKKTSNLQKRTSGK